MNPVPAQFITTSRFFNRTKSTLSALAVFLLLVISFQSQAAPLPSFPDPAMQQCLDEQAVANGWLNAEDVTVFSCVDRGVEILYGIEAFVNLNELDVSLNRISDIAPLNVFTGLTVLRLSYNPHIDGFQVEQLVNQNTGLMRLGLAGLGGSSRNGFLPSIHGVFDSLIELDYSDSRLQSLNGIENFTQLQILRLSDNYINDISPLANTYPNGPLPLTELDISNNNLSDISALNVFDGFTRLNLSGNNQIDYDQAINLIWQNLNLTSIGLADIKINDPGPVFPDFPFLYNTLTEINLSNTGIQNLNGVEQYTQLQVLHVANNDLQEIAALGFVGVNGPLPLKELDLSNNKLSSVNELSNFTGLTSLLVSGNKELDFAQLEPVISQNTGITRLGLAGIQYSNPSMPFFPNLFNSLIELDISNTGISDIYGTEQYNQLRVLKAANNYIVDIGHLSGDTPSDSLPIKELDLSNNKISDVFGLNNFTQLKSLFLSGNSAIDFNQLDSVFSQNPGLIRLGVAEIRNPVRSVPYLLSNSLVELDISNTGINSLEGIQIYTRLEKLLAADNQLTNISQLTGPYGPLPLEELDLSNNSLSNISELTNFNELLLLNVSGNSAIDFMQLQQVINQNSGLARLGMAGVPINYPGVPHLYDLFQTLIELDVSDTGITSLSGIEQYSELKVLRAAGNQLVDISSLATVGYFGALDLEVLDLSNNKIINIDPINTFTGLTSLDLSGNNDIDFSQVEFLLNQNLNIERLGIADITINVPNIPFVIQNLSHRLVELDLSRTGIVDIAGIESFQKLEALYLAGNKIQDLSPLTALNDPLLVNQSLRELDLSDNQLVDLAALNGFNRLSSLNLSSNSNIDYVQVEALLNQNIHLEQLGLAGINLNSPFMPMSVINLSQTMVELDLSSTGLQMIDGVEQFKNLKVLKLSDNQIQNLNSLINSNELLNHLDMSYNQITDISSGLNYYYNLKVLNLSGNTGIDYGQLNPVLNQNTGLKSLGVAGIPVNSSYIPSSVMNLENTLVELDMSTSSLYGVYGLEYFAKLKILKLAGNQIQDISPLSQMPMYTPPNQLRQLDLAGNNIQDIAPLTGFNGLTVLDLSGNARVDYFLLEQVITQNPGLERLGLAEIFVNSNSIPLAITNLAANLVELNMNNTGLQDIYGIEQFQKLEILKLAGNYIFDINPLASLSSVGSMQQSLQVLDLSDNQIVDVSPIQGFIGLNELNLSGNAGIDFSQVDLILNQNLSLERLGLAGIRVNSPDIPLTVTNLGTSLVELDMSNAGLQGVYGIEQLMYLEVLKLANNNIHDILPISSFAVPMKQKLRELDLSNNQITDIAALQDLNILRVLNLSGNNVIDYIQLESILYQNPGLERLGLADIKVNSPDIPSAITNLAASLLELDMSNTGLQEVYGIDQFDKLEILKLANNNIWNLNSVADLARDLYVPQQLRELDLSNNLITDVSALVGFNGLTALNLSANTGIDYLQLEPILIQNPGLVRLGLAGINVKSPLIPLAVLNLSQSLAELDMSNSGLQDIFGIEQLQKLETLNLAGNNISDIAPLSQMPVAVFGSLRELDLKNNSIVDIGPLVSYRNLEALNLSGNTGIDYNLLLPVIQQNTQLKKLGLGGIAINGPFPVYYDRINNPYQLTKLDLSNTGIIDLWGVEHYPDLDSLNVSGNNLTNIDALGMFGPLRVSFLRDLDLSNNAIMDVAPLSGFVNLESLWLSGNPDIDYQQLYGILDQNNQLTRIGLGDIAINGPIPQFMNQMTWQPYDLVELDLSNTGLTDVVGLEQYDELLSLDISGNGIQDITHLAYIPNYLLQRISLANNDIADIGPLYTLTQLNYIDLTGNNRISCIVLDELVMAFPEATIIRPTSCMIGYAPELFILHLHDGFFVIEGQMFELIADAFDPENGDLSAQVQWSSDVAGVLGTGNLLNVQLLQPGLHTITARVTDLDNNTVTQSVQITVIENVAPAVNISFPYDGFREIESIVMHTSANAYDNEDGALDHSIQWTSSIDGLVGTGGPVDLNLSVGDHVLTATVTDAFGKSASQSVNVTIIFNNPPELTILNPGPGTTTLEGTETILDASAFDIESGTLTDVIWQSNMQGNLGTGMHVVANLSVGVHTITASVTDHLGKTTTQTISHEVVFNNPPSLTITDPVNGSSVIEGQHAEFTASALDVEEGDLSANIIWSSNLVGQFGTGPFVSVPLTVGNHIITATVIDVQFKTTTQTVNHTVVFNNPPVVTINNPLNNTSIIEGTSISLSASVLDVEDGDLSTTTRWSSDIQGYLGTGSQLPVNLQVGIHTISATAMDDLNKTTTQSAVLTVAFNNPPALTLATGINGGNSEAGLAVQLSATVLDTESGDLGSVIAWSSDVSGSLGVGANLSVMLPTGPHTLIASVIDPHGKSHTLTAPYTVVDAPVLAYCDASASNTNREWIESISVSGITNNSGSQMGYGDFWNLGPIYLERAGNSISLTPGYSSNSRNEYWKIWIDYNRDGVFAGNELVVSDSGVGTLTRSFTLPADAVTGNTRMRVVMKPRQPGNACGSYRRGEVEDYRIIIQP